MNDPECEQPYVTEAIIDAISESESRIDICIFTGDLANTGTDKEYCIAESWLVNLMSAIKNPNCKLFICPGNHDCDRSLANGVELRGAAKSVKYFNDAIKKKPISTKHLEAFFNWHKNFKAKNHWVASSWEENVNLTPCEIDGVTTNVITANSALLSCGDDDAGNLCVDNAALNRALQKCEKKSELIVFAMHHPLDGKWFAPWNKEKAKTLLSQKARGCHAFLSGHVHDASGEDFANIKGQNLLELSAGASYAGTKWPQSFSIWQFNLNENTIKPLTYEFSEDSGKWVINNSQSESLYVSLPAPISNSSTAGGNTKSVVESSKYNQQNLVLLKLIKDNGILYPINQNLFKEEKGDNLIGVTKFDSLLRLPTNEEVRNTPNDICVAGVAICVPNSSSFLKFLDSSFSQEEREEIISQKIRRLSNDTKNKVVCVLNGIRQFGFIISVSMAPSIFDSRRSKTRVKATNTAILNLMVKTIFENKRDAKLDSVDMVFNDTGFNTLVEQRVDLISQDELPRKTKVKIDTYPDTSVFDFLDKFLKLTCWFISVAETEKDLHWLNELIKV